MFDDDDDDEVASSLDGADWATERRDPQGRISERGWVVESDTVALDEWLILFRLF